jgi:hypothetical protein
MLKVRDFEGAALQAVTSASKELFGTIRNLTIMKPRVTRQILTRHVARCSLFTRLPCTMGVRKIPFLAPYKYQ